MIIKRIGSKNNYKFTHKGKVLVDPDILEYIRKLVIPPNYGDVTIFYLKDGEPKILYQGFDSKNRLQRIYSQTWVKKATLKKFCELLNFGEQIKRIHAEVKRLLETEKLTRDKCIALIIRLITVCYFRLGNKRYQELYDSFGAMNIKKRHIKILKDSDGKNYMRIDFKGKKGVINSCDIYDTTFVREVKKILPHRDNDDGVFKWLDRGVAIPVRAIEVNWWLNKFDKKITSKQFRTWDSNIFLIQYLRKYKAPYAYSQTKRKKIITESLKKVSEKIHNTPSVLRKNYTQSGILDMYINQPTRYERYFMKEDTPHVALIKYLRDYCKVYLKTSP